MTATIIGDEMSGLDRVEIWFNELIQVTIDGPGPYYQWSYEFTALPHVVDKAVVYDTAGNSAINTFNLSSLTQSQLHR